MISREELNEICKKYGADKVGVAPIERFENIKEEGNPKYILPSVKSVLVLMHSIPRGWTRGAESHSDWATAYTRGGFLDSSRLRPTLFPTAIWRRILQGLGSSATAEFFLHQNSERVSSLQ